MGLVNLLPAFSSLIEVLDHQGLTLIGSPVVEVPEHQVLTLIISSVIEVSELQPLTPDFSLGYENL